MSKTPLSAEEISELERLSTMVDQEQHYRLLDVGRHSEASVVQAAYYKHSRKWHPDAFFRKEVGTYGPIIDKIFMGLTQAFQVLSDPKKKQQYDRKHPVQEAIKAVQSTDTSLSPSPSPSNATTRHRKGRRRRERERNRSTEASTDAPQTESARDMKERMKKKRQTEVLNQISMTVAEQRRKAQEHFDQGMKDYADGLIMQAATAIHLACKLDPDNEPFKEHFRVVRKEARAIKALEFIAAAENAESFSNFGRAIEQYRKAVSYECEDATPYARLAYLLSKLDPDPREILRLLQIAVQKDPNNSEYHCLLGESYFRQGMTLNAKREFQAAIAIKKDYERAIDGLKIL